MLTLTTGRRSVAAAVAALCVAALCVAALSGCAAGIPAARSVVRASSGGFHGPEPDRPTPRASFVLQDLEGRSFDFQRETGGRPTFLYFGYTNCPDACPTAMADIAAALRQAPAALRQQTRVGMVTTDPARDSPAAMWRFLNPVQLQFHRPGRHAGTGGCGAAGGRH